MGERAGAGHRLRRAAAALAVGGRVGPQLERDGHHLVAGVERELRGGGAVDAAAHGDERAPRLAARSAGAPSRAAAPSARWSASAASSAAWRLAGIEPAERRGDVVGRDPRGVEEGRALHQLDDRAARGARGAAALGVEARLDDPVALHAHGHPHEVAAGRAAGRAGVRPVRRARRARAARQMVLEEHP